MDRRSMVHFFISRMSVVTVVLRLIASWSILLGIAGTVVVECAIITTQLCSKQSQIYLTPTGETSSVTVLLNVTNSKKFCKLEVFAPKSHYINLQWHDVNRELFENHQTARHPRCLLGIFLADNSSSAVWTGDPCQRQALSDVDLLTPELTLEWSPPRFAFHVREKKIVITAVGQKDFCVQQPDQHTCMRIGREPAMCVSELLVCDGNPNCPRASSTSDEDDALCRSHLIGPNSWQQLAEDVIRKLPPGVIDENWLSRLNSSSTSSDSPQVVFDGWKDMTSFDGVSTVTPARLPSVQTVGQSTIPETSTSTTTSTLSHYGPWGYIMLGMLICGTILMFCGLWECCFRKPKTQVHQNQHHHHQPTTVLIINRQQEEGSAQQHQPPNYDDLDQPPSYLTLFPNFKQDDNQENDEQIEIVENNQRQEVETETIETQSHVVTTV